MANLLIDVFKGEGARVRGWMPAFDATAWSFQEKGLPYESQEATVWFLCRDSARNADGNRPWSDRYSKRW